jgi:hypothetical protein
VDDGALWPWLALAGLGAFHGVNPAMGWLFAVALALHRGRPATLFWALPPLALGHALSIGLVAAAVLTAGALIDRRSIQIGAGLFLMVWAGYHYAYGHRHRVRVGMTTGLAGLAVWSFLMATAHGAGLMILPALMPLCLGGPSGARTAVTAGLAVSVHTAAMLAVTALVAVVIYGWVGLAILRRAWLNLDLLWTSALALTGLLLLVWR